jgi:hypothetical protein
MFVETRGLRPAHKAAEAANLFAETTGNRNNFVINSANELNMNASGAQSRNAAVGESTRRLDKTDGLGGVTITQESQVKK